MTNKKITSRLQDWLTRRARSYTSLSLITRRRAREAAGVALDHGGHTWLVVDLLAPSRRACACASSSPRWWLSDSWGCDAQTEDMRAGLALLDVRSTSREEGESVSSPTELAEVW